MVNAPARSFSISPNNVVPRQRWPLARCDSGLRARAEARQVNAQRNDALRGKRLRIGGSIIAGPSVNQLLRADGVIVAVGVAIQHGGLAFPWPVWPVRTARTGSAPPFECQFKHARIGQARFDALANWRWQRAWVEPAEQRRQPAAHLLLARRMVMRLLRCAQSGDGATAGPLAFRRPQRLQLVDHRSAEILVGHMHRGQPRRDPCIELAVIHANEAAIFPARGIHPRSHGGRPHRPSDR